MAPHYKLTYFDVPGLGEGIRFLLSYGNIDFEDIRIKMEDFETVSSRCPNKQLPYLEIDGKMYYQSIAVCRYLAKKFNLCGSNAEEDYEIDNIADSTTDFRLHTTKFMFEKNEKRRQEMKEKFVLETVPLYCERFDESVKKNNGYFVGGKLTWIDLYFAAFVDTLSYFTEFDLAEKYEHLGMVKENVFNLPSIKAWLSKRPKVDLHQFYTSVSAFFG